MISFLTKGFGSMGGLMGNARRLYLGMGFFWFTGIIAPPEEVKHFPLISG